MSNRVAYSLGFLLVSAILLGSIYLQVVEGLIPCPLCTLQRIAFGILGVLFLIGLLLNPSRLRGILLNSLSLLVASAGTVFAGRQVWLQHFPTEGSGECGVSLHYMLQVFSLPEVAQKIFSGSAECSQPFMLFYLSTAEWALLWFIFFIVFSFYLMRRRR